MTNDEAMAELGYTVNGAGYYRMGDWALTSTPRQLVTINTRCEFRVVFAVGQWWAARRHFGKTAWRTPVGVATPMAAVALAELREWGRS